MTEKELDSMATVQIKPEYAASEVYSTTSEPPPAYKRQSTSVQIAKIVAFTVIVSSFVIGSFILASAYLQARASCDQMQALDSVLEKELMLETLQQVNKEIPRAEALIGKENEDMDLQNLDKDDTIKKEDQPKEESSGSQNIDNDQSDSSFSDSDEAEELQKTHMKVPLELDLSDLAAALLENNQKSRMNCVVERKHAEELVDSPARTMQLPFGVNLTTDPKKARITGERIAIFCESGSENERRNEDAEQMRPMFIPIQRIPISFGPQPQQIPLTHMPQSMPQQQFLQQMVQQMPPPFQQLPMRPPVPPQFMQAPRAESQYMQAPRVEQQFMQAPRVEQQFMQSPRVEQQFMQSPRVEPQVRIQVQRIPVREIHLQQEMPQLPIQIQNSNEMPQIQIQRVPLGVALQRAGITADDLRNIQRMAEERITDELRRLAVEESGSSAESSDNSSDEESDSQSNEQSTPTQQLPQMPPQLQELPEQPPQPQQTLHPPMPEPQILQIGRGAYGRSLPTPVRIPVPMMQSQEMSQESAESERPHYVQPRSIRSTDNVLLQREKRVKRCACDCNC